MPRRPGFTAIQCVQTLADDCSVFNTTDRDLKLMHICIHVNQVQGVDILYMAVVGGNKQLGAITDHSQLQRNTAQYIVGKNPNHNT